MSATRQEMVASAAQTANGNSAAFSIPNATHLFVGVDITAGSSVTTFDLWLQGSDDGGTTWYDYPADLVLKSADAAATGPLSSAPGQRDIVDNKTTTTAEQFVGIYKNIATDTIRLKWKFTGTSITFSSSYVAK